MIILIAFLLAIILVILIVVGMHYVVTSKKPEDEKVKYNNQLYEMLEYCKNECGGGNLSKRIDGVIDNLKYSDVNSSDAANGLEQMILGKISELHNNIINKKTVDANANLDEIEKYVKDRTTMTKYNK